MCDDLLNFHFDSVTCAVATNWAGVQIAEKERFFIFIGSKLAKHSYMIVNFVRHRYVHYSQRRLQPMAIGYWWLATKGQLVGN